MNTKLLPAVFLVLLLAVPTSTVWMQVDSAPPKVAELVMFPVSWDMYFLLTCSEPCELTCDYGKSAGTYFWTVRDDTLALTHQINLGYMLPGEEFYWSCTLTDEAGNSAETQEYTTAVLKHLYLPSVLR